MKETLIVKVGKGGEYEIAYFKSSRNKQMFQMTQSKVKKEIREVMGKKEQPKRGFLPWR